MNFDEQMKLYRQYREELREMLKSSEKRTKQCDAIEKAWKKRKECETNGRK